MTPEMPTLDPIEDLRIEVASLRLGMRAILTYLACSTVEPANYVLTRIDGMLEGTGAYAIEAEEMDESVRTAAIARANRRAKNLLLAISNLPLARLAPANLSSTSGLDWC
jgi:hypothetical protein